MKIFFSAYTRKGNIGDILINKLQIEEYAHYGEIYVDCTGMPKDFYDVIFNETEPNIKDFVKTYGINYRSRNMFRALRLMQKEHFTHFTKSPGPYSYIKLPIKTFLIRLIGALGYWIASKKRIKVIALGIDLNYKKESTWLLKLNDLYFSKYHLLGIRSIKNTHQLSQRLANVKYIPDMAFLYPTPVNMPKIEDRKRVALSFRKVDVEAELIERLKLLCSFFNDRHYEIEIIYQVEEDHAFCEKIFKALSEYNIVLHQPIINYYQLNIYAQYAFVFSNRLHVALMGAMHGAIPYAIISHDIKEDKIGCIFDSVFSKKMWCYQEAINNTIFEELFNEQKSLSQLLQSDILIQRDMCKMGIKQCIND